MPTDVQCLLQLHDELDLSPDEFISHLQLNINRTFLHDAQSVKTAWRSLPLNIISTLEEKFFPQWGRFKNPEEDNQQPFNTGSKSTENKKKENGTIGVRKPQPKANQTTVGAQKIIL